MKYLIYPFILLFSINSFAAECDFSTGIEPLPDGRYAYSKICHQTVGKLVADAADREEQVAALNKTIALKDLQITQEQDRTKLWMDTSDKLETKVNSIASYTDTNKLIWFGIGILTMGVATWSVGSLRK